MLALSLRFNSDSNLLGSMCLFSHSIIKFRVETPSANLSDFLPSLPWPQTFLISSLTFWSNSLTSFEYLLGCSLSRFLLFLGCTSLISCLASTLSQIAFALSLTSFLRSLFLIRVASMISIKFL